QVGVFLDIVRPTLRATSFAELKAFLEEQSGHLPPSIDEINEAVVRTTWGRIGTSKYATVTKKKHWGFFRRFVKYLAENEGTELPRNLYSSLFKFKITAKPVKRFSLDLVKTSLSALPDNLRLYALLGLNCGMTQVDMSELTKDQVDLKKRTLTRKRIK